MSTAPLPANADPTPGPNHVAIIMDGNGRWAKARGLPRVAGHRRGADAVRRVVRGAGELGIPVLTLFAFSTENWTRPADEVSDLMGLLRHYLRNELDELHKNGARLRVIGNREGLAPDIIRDISGAENMTRSNSRIDVNICINYGARAEILQAVRSLARQVAAGELPVDRIDENLFENELLTAGVPDPDLLIRTSGEQRISNCSGSAPTPSWCSSTRCGRISARNIWNRRSPSSVGVSGVMAASAADAPVGRPERYRGLLLRIGSAAILGPLLLAAIWFGFPWIDLVAALAAPLMVSEWIRLTRGRPVIRALAVFYALAAVVALLWLRHQPALGRETIIWIVLCIWATDTGAYVVGRAAGGGKLAPRISPSKTWSGLVGGMAWAAVASAATGYAFGLGETISLAMIGAGLAVVGQIGDLVESAAKRSAGVKDSGTLIPGHGGLLDRVDGLVAVLVVVALVRLAVGGGWPWA